MVIGDISSAYTINCNASANQSVIWLQTLNKTGVFYVQTDDRITIASNGQQLSFAKLALIDDEYYGCGFIDPTNNKLKLLNSYYLYIRGNFKHIFRLCIRFNFPILV